MLGKCFNKYSKDCNSFYHCLSVFTFVVVRSNYEF